jgi:F420-non-reducing hydrogenase iron-sulfur subunit
MAAPGAGGAAAAPAAAGRVLLLACAEGGRKALARMAELGYTLRSEVRVFELPCAGRVNEVMLMEALEKGFTAVLVVACRRDNCRYLEGNLRAEKAVRRLRKLLEEAGISNRFLDIVFTAPDEGRRLAEIIREFSEKPEGESSLHER